MNNVVTNVAKLGSQYASNMTRFFYGQADKKKINKKLFKRELKAAYDYGCLNLAVKIMKDQREGKYQDVGEIIGDLMLVTSQCYEATRKECSLKTMPISVETIVEQYHENGSLIQ